MHAYPQKAEQNLEHAHAHAHTIDLAQAQDAEQDKILAHTDAHTHTLTHTLPQDAERKLAESQVQIQEGQSYAEQLQQVTVVQKRVEGELARTVKERQRIAGELAKADAEKEKLRQLADQRERDLVSVCVCFWSRRV